MLTVVSQHRSDFPRRIIVMGVSGSGKSTIGSALAAGLGAVYIDGDDLHPSENIAKMQAGIPLDDAARWPWLGLIGDALSNAEKPVVLGCSALKRDYRDLIRSRAASPVLFVYLRGTSETINARLAERSGHFMPSALLASQFAILEEPGSDEWAVTVDILGSADSIFHRIVERIFTSAPDTPG